MEGRELSAAGRIRFINDSLQFLDQHNCSGSGNIRNEWGVRLNTVASTTYHGLLLTERSIFGKSEEHNSLVVALTSLLSAQVPVLVLLNTEPLPLSLPPSIRQSLLKDNGGPQELANWIAAIGLKFQNLLIVTGGDGDPSLSVITSLRESFVVKPGLNSEAQLPIPFSTGVAATGSASENNFLPVVRNGEALLGPSAVTYLLTTLCFARPLNLTEQATVIQDASILRSLVQVAEQAVRNADASQLLIKKHSEAPIADIRTGVFDPRSGAVCFQPHEWREVMSGEGRVARQLQSYFEERLPDYWQEDRPCYRRILFTPTKVILRGEQYYVNMRNESPFARISAMTEELRFSEPIARRLAARPEQVYLQSEWKLVLAFFDQIRSIALQLFSFVHSAAILFSRQGEEAVREAMTRLYNSPDANVHSILLDSVDAYYGWLMGHQDAAWNSIGKALNAWAAIKDEFVNASGSARQTAAASPRPLGDLVRRWREADHPGENLMTAILATHATSSEAVADAIGIGWGGIELPLVYGFLSKTTFPQTERRIHIGKYSHYRSPTTPIQWSSLNGETSDAFLSRGNIAVLFDDNTLTGLTLERVRDSLLLRGAPRVKIFVTRYSGERRYAHMKMSGHGAVDPEALLEDICGYIGETPFARSWSSKAKEYKSPIGVFSLSRRRILECIHNNSTVQLYDREGF